VVAVNKSLTGLENFKKHATLKGHVEDKKSVKNYIGGTKKNVNFNLDESIESMKKTGSTTNGSKAFNMSESTRFRLTEDEKNEMINDIFVDFAYGLVEIFTNQSFNMQRIKPLDFSDLKKKIQDAKVSYKQLTKEEKKLYIAKLLDLKAKQKIEKARRVEELKLPGVKQQILKIKNEAAGGPRLNFYIPFNSEEIEMAKCCILNSWEFPPPTYFDPFFVFTKPTTVKKSLMIDTHMIESKEKSDKEKSVTTKDKDKDKDKLDDSNDSIDAKTTNKSGWNKEIYLQLLHYNVEQFKEYEEPLKRVQGNWINFVEFNNIMNNYIVLHNSKFYKHSLVIDNNWYNYKTESYESSYDNKVFLLSPSESLNNNLKKNADKKCVLVVFEPNYSSNKDFENIDSYIIIQIFNHEGSQISNEICLKTHFSTFQCDYLEPEEKYYFVVKNEVTPFGYNLTIHSDHSIEALSTLTYLKQEKQLADYSFKHEHPAIKANSFYLLMKLKIDVSQPNYKINH